MSSVLLVGNKGYIGQILQDKLLKKGHDVVGMDNGFFSKSDFPSKRIRECITIYKDIRDTTPKDLEGYDEVIHLANLPNDWACDNNLDMTEDINYLGTMQLAINAKRAGVRRFIYASSCSVFGVNGDNLINEESRVSPITPYAISKLKAEQALLNMNSDDFSVTCLRNATCYGVSPRMRFDMVLNNLMGWAFTENKIKMTSDGTSWRPIVHIEDVADANIKVLEAHKDLVSGQVFAVGGENYTVNQIADIVKEVMPTAKIEHSPNAQKDFRSYKVNFSKIEKILGFKCKWTARRGAKQLFEAYNEYGLNKANFQNPEFWAGKWFDYLKKYKFVDKNLRLQTNKEA